MNRERRTLYTLALSALLSLPACTSEHGALDGTETGNAPFVLKPERIALALSSEGAHVVGEAGATSPGADVVVTSLATGATYTGTAANDGSFDVPVASATGGFTVKASLGGKSEDALVTLGGSAVASSALTCEQRSAMARSELSSIIDDVGLGCTVNSDCTAVGTFSSCTSGCATIPVGAGGAAAVDAAVQSLDEGACKVYLSAGCPAPIIPPCVSPPRLYCNQGTCAELSGPLLGACELPFDAGTGAESTPVWWYDSASKTCLPRVYLGSGGNGNRAASKEECEAACLTDTTCAKSRTPATNVCTQSGPTDGCEVLQDVTCALPCSSSKDCAGEAVGQQCTLAGVCGVVGG